MPECPKCGGSIARVIRPMPVRSKEALLKGPVSTVACVGETSCGWSMGVWLSMEAVDLIVSELKEKAA